VTDDLFSVPSFEMRKSHPGHWRYSWLGGTSESMAAVEPVSRADVLNDAGQIDPEKWQAAWAERLARPTPVLVTSPLHIHEDACWVYSDGSAVPWSLARVGSSSVVGRDCQAVRSFTPERFAEPDEIRATNENAPGALPRYVG
jgi:hypothetical protein